ncbi:hypothetical protein FOG18_07045 [Legionella israelensis]|uniref:hypothetical protein n=1 Tax=Legionella israelensis TaxID=454 RepID=UPI0011804E2D|nr:hypothetical protein [Legionella israelensis]QDP72328.1 hypothetical protein FOG18_07045 [Legionella israelensis]
MYRGPILPQADKNDVDKGNEVFEKLRKLSAHVPKIREDVRKALNNYKISRGKFWGPSSFQQRVLLQQKYPRNETVSAEEYIGHAINHAGTARNTIEDLYKKSENMKELLGAMLLVANDNLFLPLREANELKRSAKKQINEFEQNEKWEKEKLESDISEEVKKYQKFLRNKDEIGNAFINLAERVAETIKSNPRKLQCTEYEKEALKAPNPQTMDWEELAEEIEKLLPADKNHADPTDWPKLTQQAFRKEVEKALAVANMAILGDSRFLASSEVDYDENMKGIFISEEKFEEKLRDKMESKEKEEVAEDEENYSSSPRAF